MDVINDIVLCYAILLWHIILLCGVILVQSPLSHQTCPTSIIP
jgi:hypothetical protein